MTPSASPLLLFQLVHVIGAAVDYGRNIPQSACSSEPFVDPRRHIHSACSGTPGCDIVSEQERVKAAGSEGIAMKFLSRVLAVVCLIALPLAAQNQAQSQGSSQSGGRATGGGDTGRSTGNSTGAATVSSTTSVSTRGTSSGGESSRMVSSGGNGGNMSSGYYGTSGGGSYAPAPRLEGTSFRNNNAYFMWQNFLMNLGYMYRFNLDTSRFLRNSEPLLTPQFAFLAARRPLGLSMQLLAVVDELESLLNEARAGKPVDVKEIEANTRQIRILAKAIRTDRSLEYIDLRTDQDLLKDTPVEQLGIDAIVRLREVALDLNSQLKAMAEESKTSTVSVDLLKRPSYSSLSKSIEKLSKVIENSARRL